MHPGWPGLMAETSVVGRWWIPCAAAPGPLLPARLLLSRVQGSTLLGSGFERCLCLQGSVPHVLAARTLRARPLRPQYTDLMLLLKSSNRRKMLTSVSGPQKTAGAHLQSSLTRPQGERERERACMWPGLMWPGLSLKWNLFTFLTSGSCESRPCPTCTIEFFSA